MSKLEESVIADYIRSATSAVFSTMLELELEAGETYSLNGKAVTGNGVLALIGLAGTWAGIGVVQVETRLARCICSRMLLTEPEGGPETASEEVLDAVAELGNMIIGNVKNSVEPTVGPLGMSIPTVVCGRDVVSRAGPRETWVGVPFTCDGQVIEVRVCLAPSQEPSPIRHGFAGPQLHAVLAGG
jgi:chemotaxis protein CheX